MESGGRLAVVSGPSGSGKTRVLRQALASARSPARRFALANNVVDGDDMAAQFAAKLGRRATALAGRGPAWRALEREIHLCSLQGLSVVLAVDGCRAMTSSSGKDTLLRLSHLAGVEPCRATVLLVDLPHGAGDDDLGWWTLTVRLRGLSTSEVETYVIQRLAAAGCREPIFSRRAITRLHLLSCGSPRGVDQLATLCLIAGASRGREAITSELIEAIKSECHLPEVLAPLS
jgi:hypothetical protein